VRWPFKLLEQFTKIVVIQARTPPQRPAANLEGLAFLGPIPNHQCTPQEFIHNPFVGLSAPSHFRLDFGVYIFVQSQRGSHALMFS
jgi:hypothetical protein